MDQHVMPVVPNINENNDNIPNHLIIWLDKHIGQPNECILLKCNLFMAIDPTTGLFERNLNKDDIDRSIVLEMHLIIRFDEIEFMFQAFDNVEKCFEAIEKNRHKRIFFITSGSKGKTIVPSLVINFPETFIEGNWMYIFCWNMNMIDVEGFAPPTNAWAINFLERVMMFDHQDDLMPRMVLDIANYFSTKAGSLANDRQLHSACKHYHRSRIMYQRYGTMIDKNMIAKLSEIDQLINNVIQQIREYSDGEEDSLGQPCEG